MVFARLAEQPAVGTGVEIADLEDGLAEADDDLGGELRRAPADAHRSRGGRRGLGLRTSGHHVGHTPRRARSSQFFCKAGPARCATSLLLVGRGPTSSGPRRELGVLSRLSRRPFAELVALRRSKPAFIQLSANARCASWTRLVDEDPQGALLGAAVRLILVVEGLEVIGAGHRGCGDDERGHNYEREESSRNQEEAPSAEA